MHSRKMMWTLVAMLGMTGCQSRDNKVVGEEGRMRMTRMNSYSYEDAKDDVEAGVRHAQKELAQDNGGQYAMKRSSGPGLARTVDEARYAVMLGAMGTMSGSSPQSGSMGAGTRFGTGRFGTLGLASGPQDFASGMILDQEAKYAAARNLLDSEGYKDYGVNSMVDTRKDPLSTFSVDVDTASYAIARRMLQTGEALPPQAVRVEEFVNYFRYDYAGPTDNRPFAVHMDAAPSPYSEDRHILRVGVQAKQPGISKRKAANLVFLVDVSGSMDSRDKLGLAKQALRILVANMRDGDTVALVTYADGVNVVLEPAGLEEQFMISWAIANLRASGGTNMSSGIEVAYEMAARNLRPGAVSRVIVLSDGDANIGDTSHEEILQTIAGHVKEGVTLTTVGFGMNNYKDELMEQLANKGNGNYYYIDGPAQARRVFHEQLGSTLEMVAKDVKLQVQMNPEAVRRYRLIGYENRDIADRDFRNDRVDAGEIGWGHTVTALYELELTDARNLPLGVVHIRAKEPRGEKAQEWTYGFATRNLHERFADAPADFRFATAVMGAAEILRHSPDARTWSMDRVTAIAEAANAGENKERQEFIGLMRYARGLPALAAHR